MQSGNVDHGRTEIAEIRRKITTRESAYGGVKVTTAMVKPAGEWKHFLTRYLILHRDDANEYQREFKYDELWLREGTMMMKDFLSALDDLDKKGVLVFSGPPQVTTIGRIQKWPSPQQYYHPSNEVGFNLDWPGELYAFMPDENRQPTVVGGPFASLD